MTPGPEGGRNFLVVDDKTETKKIEAAFEDFTQTRKDIGIVLINQHVRRSHPVGCVVVPLCHANTFPRIGR